MTGINMLLSIFQIFRAPNNRNLISTREWFGEAAGYDCHNVCYSITVQLIGNTNGYPDRTQIA